MNLYLIALSFFLTDLYLYTLFSALLVQSTLALFVVVLFSSEKTIMQLSWILLLYCLEYMLICERMGFSLITLMPLMAIGTWYQYYLKNYPIILYTLFLAGYFMLQNNIILPFCPGSGCSFMYTLQQFCATMVLSMSYLKYTHWAARQSLKTV